MLGNSKYAVIECKNGVVSEVISKHDCNQLNGSIEWFKNLYKSTDIICCPIMIHPSKKFDISASPNPDIKIIINVQLEKFKYAVKKFAETFVQNDFLGNTHEINKLLNEFKLNSNNFISEYTVDYSKKT